MKPFIVHAGLVLPLDRANVDTDALMPKPFLKSIGRTGFAANLFDDWRYLDPYVEGSTAPRRENPDFILNRHPYRHASILLARDNFGCGSSREHAAWALAEYGFRAVVAPSFSDIFTANAFKNGLLPVVLEHGAVQALFEAAARCEYFCLVVDLRAQVVADAAGTRHAFSVPAAQREALLSGTDEIGATLAAAERIAAFERTRLAQQPWV